MPLMVRAVCTAITLELGGSNVVLAKKLLFASRLGYAMFLWALKFCLLSFYSRMTTGSIHLQKSARVMWWFLVLTLVAILLATLLECRPLSLFWALDQTHVCNRGLANLLTMAICNIVSDIALLIFPIPALKQMKLPTVKKIQLGLVFGAGLLVIAITVARIPLIIHQSVTQSVRSLWASIEIAVACLVANVAFFYALIKDMNRGHSNSRASLSARGVQALGISPADQFKIEKLADLRLSNEGSADEDYKQEDLERLSWTTTQQTYVEANS